MGWSTPSWPGWTRSWTARRFKSVLIEVNGNLQEHRDKVGRMSFKAMSIMIQNSGSYELGPLTDKADRVLAALFYLPALADRTGTRNSELGSPTRHTGLLLASRIEPTDQGAIA